MHFSDFNAPRPPRRPAPGSSVFAINCLGSRFLSHRVVGCRRSFHGFVRDVFDRCDRKGHAEISGAPLLRAIILAGAADPAPEVSEPALEWLNGHAFSGKAADSLSARLQALHAFAPAGPPGAMDLTAGVTRRAMAAAEERWSAVAAALLLAVPEGNHGRFNQKLHLNGQDAE